MTEIYQPSQQDPTDVELIVGFTPILNGNNGYALYDNNGILGEQAFPSGGASGSVISTTNSGDNKNYSLAQGATTIQYYIIMNNGSYTTDDTTYGFSVSGTTLTFNTVLPSDLANTIIKLICV